MAHHAYHSPEPLPGHAWTGIFMLLMVVLGLLFLWGHDRYQLFDVDEAIFTEATAEMVAHNNYVLPTYNEEPRYHKPPLIYWLQAASLQAFGALPYQDGLTPLAARLPSGLCGLLTIFIFYWFVARLTGRQRYAVTASAILGLNLLWVIVARAAIADAALNLIMLTTILYALWLLYEKRQGLFYQLTLGLLLALGMLAKGPVALVIPGTVVGMAVLIKPGLWQNLKTLNPFPILLALMVGLAPWMLMIIQTSGLDFFKEFIFVHNLQRFFGGLNNTHTTSPLYYPIVFLIGFFPWSIIFITAISSIFEEFLENLRSSQAKNALPLIGMLWCFAVIIIFSFSQTKLVHYIVPALPGAALFVASWLENLSISRGRTMARRLAVPVAILLGLFFLVFNRLLTAAQPGVVDPVLNVLRETIGFEWPPHDPLTADILTQIVPLNWAPLLMGVILIFGTYMGFKVLQEGFREGALTLIAMQVGFLALVVAGLMPVVSAYIQQPLVELGWHIRDEAQGDTVYHLGLHHPSVRLVSGVPFIEVSKPIQIDGVLADRRTLILHEAHRLNEIRDVLPATAMVESACTGGYCVLTVDDRPLELRTVKGETDE